MLLRDEQQVLIVEYRVLNNAVWERGRASWLVNSVLIPSSILVVLQVIINRNTLGNVVSGLFSLLPFLLAFYCWLHHLFSNRVNKICWRRIHQIEEALGIQGNKRIYSEVKTRWWYPVRTSMWSILFFLLITIYLIVSVGCFLS